MSREAHLSNYGMGTPRASATMRAEVAIWQRLSDKVGITWLVDILEECHKNHIKRCYLDMERPSARKPKTVKISKEDTILVQSTLQKCWIQNVISLSRRSTYGVSHLFTKEHYSEYPHFDECEGPSSRGD